MLIFLFFSFLFLLAIGAYIVYVRYSATRRYDRMALLNLLTEEEKKYFIHEYKKTIAAQLVYELIAEQKLSIEIAHEVVKERRDK